MATQKANITNSRLVDGKPYIHFTNTEKDGPADLAKMEKAHDLSALMGGFDPVSCHKSMPVETLKAMGLKGVFRPMSEDEIKRNKDFLASELGFSA